MKYFITFMLVSFSLLLSAQMHDNHWHTGLGGWIELGGGFLQIDFSELEKPKYELVFDTIFVSRTNVSMSDSSGNFLFFTNGETVYDRSFEVMENGDKLIGTGQNIGNVHDQCALSFEVPNSENLYYLFTIEYISNGQSNGRLFLNVIDMSMNNGKGEVITKKQLINDNMVTGLGLTATKHGNGRDWWLVVHQYNTGRYYSYLISESGLVEYQNEQDVILNKSGDYRFSPRGDNYIMLDGPNLFEDYILTVFDFNRCTGRLSNPIQKTLASPSGYLDWGGAFSPNGRYYYACTNTEVYQYDLWADDIFASEKNVATWDGTLYGNFVAIDIATPLQTPDGKIYINSSNSTNTLHRIEYPNREGLASKLIQNRVKLPNLISRDMPNHPNYRLGPDDDCPCDTLGLDNHPLARYYYEKEDEAQPLQVTFTDLSDYEPTSWTWSFGDGQSSVEQYPVHDYANPGIYQACLIVCNANSCDTLCKEIDMLTPPTYPEANYSYVQHPTYLEFTDLSTDRDWVKWDFGHDSLYTNFSNIVAPQHTFPDSGVYNVCQIACTPLECDTFCQDIHVSETLWIPTTAAFSYTQPAPIPNIVQFENASISDEIYTYHWDFGDPSSGNENTSNKEDPRHTYFEDGVYLVCLTSCSTNDCDTYCEYIIIGDVEIPVSAGFSYSTNQQNGYSFTDQSQSDNLISWTWTFGDGTSSNAQNPNHTYDAAGIYEVCLEVCSPTTCDTFCQNIEVVAPNIPITAAWVYTPTDDHEINFTDQTQSDSIISWAWHFGDSQTSNAQNPNHTYTAAGIYEVCLEVCSPTDCDTFCQDIEVVAPNIPISAAWIYSPIDDYEINFTDQSQSDSILSWTWHFGDSHMSNAQSPNHVYADSGIYEVCLEVCSPTDCDTFCQEINVQDPLPIFAHFGYAFEGLDSIFFQEQSQNGAITWFWDFGDGQTSTEQNPMHVYGTSGVYQVCLTVCDSLGACAEYCDEVVVMLSSSVSLNNEAPSIKLHPNPSNEILWITKTTEDPLRLVIRDVLGRVVYVSDDFIGKRVSIVTIDFPEGQYFIEAIGSRASGVVRRFVVVH